MSPWLAWLRKELRAQRSMVATCLLAVFATLSLVALSRSDLLGTPATLVGLFVTSATACVLLLIVPDLARGEFVDERDHLLRRLPGALAPALLAKATVALLAVAVIPTLGHVVGCAVVLALGGVPPSVDEVLARGLGTGPLLLLTVVFLPWLMAASTWLPGGRLALGVTLLLGVVGVQSFDALERVAPGSNDAIDLRWLLAATFVLGVVVAAASWIAGRRGGDSRRSARLGGAVAASGWAIVLATTAVLARR